MDTEMTKTELRQQHFYLFFKNIAKEKGGVLLSQTYQNMHKKLLFQCAYGHQFYASGHSVHQKKSWCPVCAGNKRLTWRDLQEHAQQKKGMLLTNSYMGIRENHVWACKMGHLFELTPALVLYNKSWCPVCRRQERQQRHAMKQYTRLLSMAELNGITPLTKTYFGNRVGLLFKCSQGHIFERTPEQIRKGSRCPKC